MNKRHFNDFYHEKIMRLRNEGNYFTHVHVKLGNDTNC